MLSIPLAILCICICLLSSISHTLQSEVLLVNVGVFCLITLSVSWYNSHTIALYSKWSIAQASCSTCISASASVSLVSKPVIAVFNSPDFFIMFLASVTTQLDIVANLIAFLLGIVHTFISAISVQSSFHNSQLSIISCGTSIYTSQSQLILCAEVL